MRVVNYAAMAMSAVLCGCGEALEKEFAEAGVPADIQVLMAAEFPADGQIHVQSDGVFEVKPETVFCVQRDGIGLDQNRFERALASLGKYKYSNVSKNNTGIIGISPECKFGNFGNSIFVSGFKTSNRSNKPYKLLLAVWQENSSKDITYWVGGVERSPENYLPCRTCFSDIYNGKVSGTDTDEPARSSMREDAQNMSNLPAPAGLPNSAEKGRL